MLPVAVILLAQTRRPIVTPYAQDKPTAIRSVQVQNPSVPRLSREEITVVAQGTFDNPFDPDDVRLDAHVIPPKGADYDIPGFLYQPFARQLVGGKEILTKEGDPSWRIRLCPRDAGRYRVEITFHDRNGDAKAEARFTSVPADGPAFIHVSPRDRRYFEREDGSAFYPVGANVCWGNDPGTYSYDQWFKDYGAVGVNYARLWLDPGWVTLAMTVPGKPSEGKGLGQINLGDAWRLDYVFDLARADGLNLQLCMESYNELRDRDAYPYWENAPENAMNGGPLRIWSDYWTDPTTDRYFRAKMRYLVARYAANANLFAWEFWNEVDLVRDFDADAVHDWHQRMATALKALDPYGHPLTTSVSNTQGNRIVDLVPALDFFQTHLYNAPDLAGGVVDQQSRKAWGRPHLVAEIGADGSGPRIKDDPLGMQIHDPIWASIASGVSGSASPWWWDSLTAPNHLYPIFGAAKKFVQGLDWPGESLQLADLTFAYQSPPTHPPHRDLILDGGPVSWSASPQNQPVTIAVSADGVTGNTPLSGIQHGLVNHPALHNPVIFKVQAPRSTTFDIIVGGVSGFGGATLRVDLDGEHVMTREFSSPPNETATMTKYAGKYQLLIPKGDHTVKVEDVGADWFMVSYAFEGLLPRNKPPVEGWAVVGNDAVLAWFRPEGRTWARVCERKETVPSAPPSVVGLAGLAAGTWLVEYWDTWKGQVVDHNSFSVGIDGKIRVPLPDIATDLAVRMRRQAK
jgi:hypothetical protein